ncbi:immunoglobulin superfamily member 8 [Chanos chanos]|uniref:immunoglobulin superfamily member 8 n=1 Tax=Chanos chanos TaxID=29144 RepID=UPI0011F21D73|nr:immunoglobulin superfamily member 8 [Chanos chanos]
MLVHFALGRDVTVPNGPLYRVAGFPLSLPCVVSDYEGPRTQNFEWFLYLDNADDRQIGVVSTKDPGFPYAPFQGRVKSGEVRVERDSDNNVRLVIQRLRLEDRGRYECYTPTTDSRYLGKYSASVVVKVIPDTLLISHTHTLSSQPMAEGSELQLTCAASVQSEQHTHLSITFGVRATSLSGSELGGHNVREIIAIDHELRVNPGRSGTFEKRYRDGGISLEKRRGDGGMDLYVMRMNALTPVDSGSYYCETSQWILDPDGSWERIAQRTLELGNLTVKPLADALQVSAMPQGEVILPVGSPLSLTCELSGVGSLNRSAVLVRWLRRGSLVSDGLLGGAEVEVGRIGPDGVVQWGNWGDDISRGRVGAIEKEAEGRYTLRLFSARASDSGTYTCVASIYRGTQNPGPRDPPSISQRSDGVTFNLRTKGVRVSATIELPRRPLLKRGSTVTVLCNVSVTTTGPSQVEVQWLRKNMEPERTEDKFLEGEEHLVAVLNHQGLSHLNSSGSEISVDCVAPGCYRLRVFSAQMEDQGHYQCKAEVWKQDSHGDWYNTGTRAKSNTVRVYLYAQAADLLLIPLVVGVSSALFIGVIIIATVTCCFMNRLARQRSQK